MKEYHRDQLAFVETVVNVMLIAAIVIYIASSL